jgi:hypothetical protein
MSATADWNTIASDLQRAVNNLAWFVLESMSVPEQPPMTVTIPLQNCTLHHLAVSTPPPPPPPLPLEPQSQALLLPVVEETVIKSKKRNYKTNRLEESPNVKKQNLGQAVDRLIAETLV